jgi:hypothetical protein
LSAQIEGKTQREDAHRNTLLVRSRLADELCFVTSKRIDEAGGPDALKRVVQARLGCDLTNKIKIKSPAIEYGTEKFGPQFASWFCGPNFKIFISDSLN